MVFGDRASMENPWRSTWVRIKFEEEEELELLGLFKGGLELELNELRLGLLGSRGDDEDNVREGNKCARSSAEKENTCIVVGDLYTVFKTTESRPL